VVPPESISIEHHFLLSYISHNNNDNNNNDNVDFFFNNYFHNTSYQHYSPFKFLNVWAGRPDFPAIVSTTWQTQVNGNPMFKFTTKLRLLKAGLRKIHQHHTSHISSRVAKAKDEWNIAQTTLDLNPTTVAARSIERELTNTYMQLCKEEESFFKKRSRIQWLQLGDRNTKFFYNSLMHREVQNRIHTLMDEDGNSVHD
jgi:hypothetical protein